MTAGLWDSLMPPAVRVVQATEEMWSAPPTERERACVEHAVPRRQREFQAGRAAARAALRSLGVHEFDLLPGPNRAPVWPAGIVGSITHTTVHCAAAVARAADVLAVGIDVEVATPLMPELIERICSTIEQRSLNGAGAYGPGVLAKLIFSAKEAVYKAYFPAVGRLLEFRDVDVQIEPRSGTFVAVLSADVPPLLENRLVVGRFALRDGVIVTGVVVPNVGKTHLSARAPRFSTR